MGGEARSFLRRKNQGQCRELKLDLDIGLTYLSTVAFISRQIGSDRSHPGKLKQRAFIAQ